ncbi:Uncharacterised protein [Escherichia coli]|uniref:Uncharacterized protein n=1 Tax=Escherichia coli TaxID=562 RepID=A0A485JNF2_ECOLX|nr:Uncharacterised protein [Escherichia coli]
MIGLCVTIIFFLLYTGISWYLEYKESEITVNEVPVLEKKLESLDTPWSGVSKTIISDVKLYECCYGKNGLSLLLFLDGCQNQLRPAMRGNISYTIKRNDGLSLWLSFANEFFPHMNILTSAIYQKMRLYSHGGYILKSIL